MDVLLGRWLTIASRANRARDDETASHTDRRVNATEQRRLEAAAG
ncbi:hypothetical protein [Natrinema altunense]|nr:hypothetical protein [Natrinema altunense]